MKRVVRLVAVIAVLAIVAAACGATRRRPSSPSASVGGGGSRGRDAPDRPQVGDVSAAFDPQKEYYQLSFEIFNAACSAPCTDERHAGRRGWRPSSGPDLAADLATVCDDGLTWTFPIKPGVIYSPAVPGRRCDGAGLHPCVEREADLNASSGGYAFYYSAIEGFDDLSAGEADTISGITAVDDQTLEVTVTEPTGDLAWRFAMPADRPDPAERRRPRSEPPRATRRTTGVSWSARALHVRGNRRHRLLGPGRPAGAVSGYSPGPRSCWCVTPRWDPATDDLRPAYADRSRSRSGVWWPTCTTRSRPVRSTTCGRRPRQSVLQEYSTNPDLQDRLHVYRRTPCRTRR